MSNAVPEQSVLKAQTIKLLEKSGRHPQLTPRILRTKLEQKLGLAAKALRKQREYIKDVAIVWWLDAASEGETSEESLALQRLSKLAKAANKGPAIFKAIANMSTDDKINYLRKR